MKCLEENCNKQPHFNLPNKKDGIYCKEHSKANMIDVKSKRCLYENCNKQPNFNLPDKKEGIYCKEHKKENMIDIIHKRCLEEKCNKLPSCNFENEKNGIYCSEHKKENMIDVKNKSCQHENCNKIPNFNLPNEKYGIYCKEHSKANMINVKSKRCLEEHCDKQPLFNLPNEKYGIYCKNHKKEGMFDITHKKCLEENCDTQVTNKYKGYCIRCFVYKFPDIKISRNYKIKENHMTDFIKEVFKDEVITFDKQTGGCSKRRPDVYIDKFTHVVIIECDKNQHKDTSCENRRMMELFQDFGNRSIVFIRFNPDSYINEDGKKITSSFKMHKKLDVPMIRDQKEWSGRLDVLKETINKHLITIPNKEITYEYLFYNYS